MIVEGHRSGASVPGASGGIALGRTGLALGVGDPVPVARGKHVRFEQRQQPFVILRFSGRSAGGDGSKDRNRDFHASRTTRWRQAVDRLVVEAHRMGVPEPRDPLAHAVGAGRRRGSENGRAAVAASLIASGLPPLVTDGRYSA